MKETYTEYRFLVNPKEPATEILIAELSEVGFDSFEETEDGLLAYLPSSSDKDDLLKNLNILESIVFDISYQKKTIEQKNWNEQWEKDFQPIEISANCRIRTSFHPDKNLDYEIIINPKMSFGTGHHSTTHLMLEFILKEALEDKTVLDMGCGTGVLAILAEKKNAKHIDAIDIDPWSYENTLENVQLNHCKRINVFEGDASMLEDRKYDVIFANINRNILLQDMSVYVDCLHSQGILLMSGFYEKDLQLIREKAESLKMKYISHEVKNDWTAARFRKKS